jgi:hypothetical protein
MFSTYSEKSASLLNDDWLTNITTAHLDAAPDPKKQIQTQVTSTVGFHSG